MSSPNWEEHEYVKQNEQKHDTSQINVVVKEYHVNSCAGNSELFYLLNKFL